jgi:hypothetical protein
MTYGKILAILTALFVFLIDIGMWNIIARMHENIVVAMLVAYFNVYGIHLALWWWRKGSSRSYDV